MTRRGFSLVELLVVVAILVVILSMMLPAIQRVREASSKIVCSQNLHQIGIALHAYLETQGVFPAGYDYFSPIAPYMSLGTVKIWSGGRGWARSDAVIRCPSHTNLSDCRMDYASALLPPPLDSALINNYCAAGVSPMLSDNKRRYRIMEIRDGLSNTAMLAEKEGFAISKQQQFEAYFPGINNNPLCFMYYDLTNVNSNNLLLDFAYGSAALPWRVGLADGIRGTAGMPARDGAVSYFYSQTWVFWSSYPYYAIEQDSPYGYYFAGLNLTDQDAWIEQYSPNGRMLEFGSAHVSSINVLMCDGGVRPHAYGRPGLIELFGIDNGPGPNYD